MLPDLPVVYASGRVNYLDPRLRVSGSMFVAKPYVPELVGRLLADAVQKPHNACRPKRPTRYCSSAPRARNSSSQWM